MSTMQNLDFIAAKYAPEILKVEDKQQSDRKKKEALINRAIGILAEQGPFALMLWAETESAGDGGAKKIGDTLWDGLMGAIKETGLLKNEAGGLSSRNRRLKSFSEDICSDFVKLTMVRQLFERILIYARYYAKAGVSTE